MAVVVSLDQARLRAQQEETRRQACRCMTAEVHPQLKWGADGWRCSECGTLVTKKNQPWTPFHPYSER